MDRSAGVTGKVEKRIKDQGMKVDSVEIVAEDTHEEAKNGE